MKNIFLLLFLFQFSQSEAQDYFWPVENGLVNPKDGKEYYTIELKGKDSVQIYNAIIDKITKGFTEPEKAIVAKKESSYIKIYGMQPKSIGSGEYSYDFTYNLEIDIKNEKYRIYYSGIKLNRTASKGEKMTLHIKSGSNLFSENGGYDKFLLNKKGKPAMGFRDEFLDLVKWTNHIAKIFDVTESINEEKKKDDW